MGAATEKDVAPFVTRRFLDADVKAKDLRKKVFSTCARTSNRPKLSNTHTSAPATSRRERLYQRQSLTTSENLKDYI